MRRYFLSFTPMAALVLLLSHSAVAQDKKEKDKEKESTRLSEYDELIIKKKTDKNAKVTVEINKDGDVTVNGKSIDDYDDENLSIRKRKAPRYSTTISPFRAQGGWNSNGGNTFRSAPSNKPFLGITSEKAEGGVRVIIVAEESAAEKAGLKENDIITKVGDNKIGNPEDLFAAVSKYKPEDKVTITYKRDGKEQTTTATLGRRRAAEGFSFVNPEGGYAPRIEAMPNMEDFNFDFHGPEGQMFLNGASPRLGIKAQDTEDGKGVKVLSVEDESAADKAGVKEDDVITEFDGTAVNGADELARLARTARTKPTVKVKVLRDGKAETIEIKTPRKLKTANL